VPRCKLEGYGSEDSELTPVQKALKERGIDTMLEEARESNRENDADNMKAGCKSFQIHVMVTLGLSVVENRMYRRNYMALCMGFPRSTVHTGGRWRSKE